MKLRAMLIAAMMIGQASLAAADAGMSFFEGRTYNLHGSWKTPAGVAGAWDGTVNFVKNHTQPESYVMTKDLVVHGADGDFVLHESMNIFDAGHGFFTIKRADNQIGGGYCFEKVCHWATHENGSATEETWKFSENGIGLIGSHHSAGEHVAWQGMGNREETH